MRKKRDFGYIPSEYQEKVFDFVEHGVGNGVIKAVAGSGKTSTIVSAMQLVPKNKKCLFIAFNKSIVQELEERLKGYSNCAIKTIHSLGYSIVRRNLGANIALDEYKYTLLVKNNIGELTSLDISEKKMSRRELLTYVNSIIKLIDFARFNCAQSAREIRRVADTYGIPVMYDECDIVEKCLNWGKEHTETVDYTDMVWLPYELSLRPFGNQYDWIFADEVQDFSKMAVELFFRCFKRGTRFVAVGDTDQSINMFAGSSQDAFERLCNYPNTEMFSLPVTYRCAKRIVDFVKRFSPMMVPRDDAPNGSIIYDCGISNLHAGDMVLARSRTPLFKLYAKLLKMGVPSYMKGQDYGRELIAMIDGVDPNVTKIGRDLLHDGLFIRLYDDMLEERNALMRKRGLDMRDATLSDYIMSIYDSINAIIALSATCVTRSDLVKRIESMFDEENNGVCLSTIHKAKGLEADNVYILCNSSMPSSLATKEWEIEQERNLQYVAYTRPKNVLAFVSEKIIRPSASLLAPESILEDVRNIEMCVCRVLGKTPAEDIPAVEFSRFIATNMADVSVNHGENGAKWEKRKDADKSILDDLIE